MAPHNLNRRHAKNFAEKLLSIRGIPPPAGKAAYDSVRVAMYAELVLGVAEQMRTYGKQECIGYPYYKHVLRKTGYDRYVVATDLAEFRARAGSPAA